MFGKHQTHTSPEDFKEVPAPPGIWLTKILPFIISGICLILLVQFIYGATYAVGATDGKCRVIDFVADKSCKDCIFQIEIDGHKPAMLQLTGEPDENRAYKSTFNAFECCPPSESQFSCCHYGPDVERKFCDTFWPDCEDRKEWNCNYKTRDGENIYDLREGSVLQLWISLIICVSIFITVFPSIFFAVRFLQKRRDLQIKENEKLQLDKITEMEEAEADEAEKFGKIKSSPQRPSQIY